jgi:hypothetical protein
VLQTPPQALSRVSNVRDEEWLQHRGWKELKSGGCGGGIESLVNRKRVSRASRRRKAIFSSCGQLVYMILPARCDRQ